MKDPASFFDILTSKYHYKLKGVEEPKYHLGGNYFCNPDGTLAWGAQRYVTRMLENFEHEEGSPLPKHRLPLEKQYHPELDQSTPQDKYGIKKYQSLIGALQVCYLR